MFNDLSNIIGPIEDASPWRLDFDFCCIVKVGHKCPCAGISAWKWPLKHKKDCFSEGQAAYNPDWKTYVYSIKGVKVCFNP